MISIVIPTYNEEKCLPRLLKCTRQQTFRKYEIIVADAKSEDNTRKIAKAFGCKVVKGGMPAVGRNAGAGAAKFDILLFLDADSQIDRNFLKDGLKEFEKRNLDVAGIYLHPASSNILDKLFLHIFNSWIFATQWFYPNAAGSGIFCRKWLHRKVNGFDEKIRLSEDMDYVKRCGRIGKFRILRAPKLQFSMRRYEKEGRIAVGSKLLFSAVYRILFGEIKTNVFKYNLRYRK